MLKGIGITLCSPNPRIGHLVGTEQVNRNRASENANFALSVFVLPKMQRAPISSSLGLPPALFPSEGRNGEDADDIRIAVGCGVPSRSQQCVAGVGAVGEEGEVDAGPAALLPRLLVLDFESGAPMAEAKSLAAHTEPMAYAQGIGALAYCQRTHSLASSSGRTVVLWE